MGQSTFQNLYPHRRPGTTGLGNGERVAKDCPRIEAIGAVDELNCAVGRVLVHDLREPIRECLEEVQHRLFDLGGELSIPGYQAIKAEDVARLEAALNDFNEQLPPLKEFILPGGSRGRRIAMWRGRFVGAPNGG